MPYDLYLLRHAKSERDAPVSSDFQRPLNKRGLSDAMGIARWMHAQGCKPGVLMSSSALRAWQTTVAVCTELGIPEQHVAFTGDLYLADGDKLIKVVKSISNEIKSVLIVGHNPGLEDLFRFLVEDRQGLNESKLLPTATLAHIELQSWAKSGENQGKLRKVVRPADLNDVQDVLKSRS